MAEPTSTPIPTPAAAHIPHASAGACLHTHDRSNFHRDSHSGSDGNPYGYARALSTS